MKQHKQDKKLLKTKILKLYKKGYHLNELCKEFKKDAESVLLILKESALKRKELYLIYDMQEVRNISNEIFEENEIQLIEKFFPSIASTQLMGGYYWHWKDKFKKAERIKKNCVHDIRHIRCAKCNTILADATAPASNQDNEPFIRVEN